MEARQKLFVSHERAIEKVRVVVGSAIITSSKCITWLIFCMYEYAYRRGSSEVARISEVKVRAVASLSIYFRFNGAMQ